MESPKYSYTMDASTGMRIRYSIKLGYGSEVGSTQGLNSPEFMFGVAES